MEYYDRKEYSNYHVRFGPLPSKQNAVNMAIWRNLERRNLQICNHESPSQVLLVLFWARLL